MTEVRKPTLVDYSSNANPIFAAEEAMTKLKILHHGTREVLLPALIAWFQTHARNAARVAENVVNDSKQPLVAAATAAGLLAQGFARADGSGMVLWGEATIDDHVARIEYLRKKADGLHRTIDLHEKAVHLLKKSKAATLNALNIIDLGEELRGLVVDAAA